MRRAFPQASQKRLLRLISARTDMKYATDAAIRLAPLADRESRYHLFLSMVVSYARPFTQSHGIGSLLCEYPEYPDFTDPELNQRHERMLQLRHSFFSHSSVESTKAFLLAPHATNPATQNVCDDYDYAVAKLHFLEPEYAPWLYEVVEALAQRLDADIPVVLREIGGTYLREGEVYELDTGKPPFEWNDKT
jgi:hypothetical protein